MLWRRVWDGHSAHPMSRKLRELQTTPLTVPGVEPKIPSKGARACRLKWAAYGKGKRRSRCAHADHGTRVDATDRVPARAAVFDDRFHIGNRAPPACQPGGRKAALCLA